MPFITRTRRRWVAVSAVTLVAFAHAAIALSGCLTNAMPVSESSCEQHRPPAADTLICRAHLQTESQTLGLAKLPQVPHLDTPVLVVVPEQAIVLAYGVADSFPAPVSGAPPPSLNVLYSRSLT